MNCDEVIWQVVNHQFCSYKVKTPSQNFCRNEYNSTGLCNRQACPLANSRYATVREHEGILYLYVKTPERAHSPAKMWERIKLKKNFAQALQQINNELVYWPKAMIHRCKQRLIRITQYLIRMRKLKLKPTAKLVAVNKKVKRREATRERKAEVAAKLERSIEKELIERLKNKAYGDEHDQPLNVNEDVWKHVLNGDQINDLEDDLSNDEDEDENEIEDEREFVEDISEEEEEDQDLEDIYIDKGHTSIMKSNHSYDGDAIDSDSGSDSDNNTINLSNQNKHQLLSKINKRESTKSNKKKRTYIEIEYENEDETLTNSQVQKV